MFVSLLPEKGSQPCPERGRAPWGCPGLLAFWQHTPTLFDRAFVFVCQEKYVYDLQGQIQDGFGGGLI